MERFKFRAEVVIYTSPVTENPKNQNEIEIVKAILTVER